jgi:hypothetical protein
LASRSASLFDGVGGGIVTSSNFDLEAVEGSSDLGRTGTSRRLDELRDERERQLGRTGTRTISTTTTGDGTATTGGELDLELRGALFVFSAANATAARTRETQQAARERKKNPLPGPN